MSDHSNNPDWVKHAYVGMKVVCVDVPTRAFDLEGDWSPHSRHVISVGDIRTIKELNCFPGFSYTSLWFGEFNSTGGKTYYDCRLFKPLRSTGKGMEVIKAILKSPERQIEDA